ncbi:MAG: S41 family peptidase, partial [Peptococcaceae bacterium]|nr:S41 family peptidase [Peptococcaceae bacterium]
NGLVDSLNDPYSSYLDAKTFSDLKEQIKGSFAGLGILVTLRDEDITIVKAYKDAPAYREGIKDGDVILAVDETDVDGLDLDDVIAMIRGPVGTEVNLTIRRAEEIQLLLFTVAREEIVVPTVEAHLVEDTQILYVAISQFNERTGMEMREILAQTEAENADGIILDLRYNPGGELLSAVDVAKHFIPEGPIVFIENRAGDELIYESNGDTMDLPLVVLINGESASASEIIAGAVKDTGAGVLVGTRTFGKGIVQTVFPLRAGAGLKLTTAHYLTPDKNDIHEKGVEPDVHVEQDRNNLFADIQMERAVEVMNGLISAVH